MVRIAITIQGVTPLLCNAFTDAAAQKATTGHTMVAVGNRGTPREQAESKLYLGLAGEPMIPMPNIFRCIIDAGKYFKAGKSKITTLKSSLIPAAVDFGNQVEIKLQHDDPWEVDTRPVRIPSTGGRILCHRPKFDQWSLQFYVNLDELQISEDVFRDVVDAGGSKIGLGDFRPDCKGMFGKHKVTHWCADWPIRAAGGWVGQRYRK